MSLLPLALLDYHLNQGHRAGLESLVVQIHQPIQHFLFHQQVRPFQQDRVCQAHQLGQDGQPLRVVLVTLVNLLVLLTHYHLLRPCYLEILVGLAYLYLP